MYLALHIIIIIIGLLASIIILLMGIDGACLLLAPNCALDLPAKINMIRRSLVHRPNRS